MNTLHAILDWPRRPGNHYVPLYVIAWRVLWMPVICIGLLILCFGVLFAYGPLQAAKVWQEVY